MQSSTLKKIRPLVALGGIGLLAYIILANRHDDEGWLPASIVGKRGTMLYNSLTGKREEDAALKSLLSSGETIHAFLEETLKETVGGTGEKDLLIPGLRLKGRADFFTASGIPIEIKTISSKAIERLHRPLYYHASQLNVYTIASGAPYGYVVYVDADQQARKKIFRVPREPARLISDVNNVISAIIENRESVLPKYIKWLQKMYKNHPSFLQGIRQSSGTFSSFEGLKEHLPDFPGGRLASSIQASRYKNLSSSRKCTPTMGLTIRKHETAIGHKSRCKRAKRVRSHPNTSRMLG